MRGHAREISRICRSGFHDDFTGFCGLFIVVIMTIKLETFKYQLSPSS